MNYPKRPLIPPLPVTEAQEQERLRLNAEARLEALLAEGRMP